MKIGGDHDRGLGESLRGASVANQIDFLAIQEREDF